MADFSNKFIPTESMGARLGSSLGQGLEALAAAKLKQHQAQQFKNQFKNIGVNQQGAELLSAFQNQPELLKPLLEHIGMFMNQSQTGAQGLPMEQQSWQPNTFTGVGQQIPGLEQYQNGLPGGLELGQAISQLGRQAPPVGQQPNQRQPFNPFESAASRYKRNADRRAEEQWEHKKKQDLDKATGVFHKPLTPTEEIKVKGVAEQYTNYKAAINLIDEILEDIEKPTFGLRSKYIGGNIAVHWLVRILVNL